MPEMATGTAGAPPPDGRGGCATGLGGTDADDTGTRPALAVVATSGSAAGRICGSAGGSLLPSGGGGPDSRRGFGGGASLRPGGFESERAAGGWDVGAAGASRFVISGVDGAGTRGAAGSGGDASAGLDPGGLLGVPTESTGRLGILDGGGGSLTSAPTFVSSPSVSGGLDAVMRA
jgi:hypothetical protein